MDVLASVSDALSLAVLVLALGAMAAGLFLLGLLAWMVSGAPHGRVFVAASLSGKEG